MFNAQPIVQAGPNSLASLLPVNATGKGSAPGDLVLHEVGSSSYVNADGVDQHFPKGSSLSEKRISEGRFLQPPFFVSLADRDFFYRAAWNNRIPKIGESIAWVSVRAGGHKCVVLSRLSEGTILDEDGIYKGLGFLRSAPAVPQNMRVERGQVSYKAGSLDAIDEMSVTIAVPINGNLQNYYHWLVDCFLSLETINASIKAPFSILLPSKLSSFSSIQYGRSLAICGFDHIPIVQSSADLVRVERAIWLECRDPFEDIPAGIIRGFQSRISAKFVDNNVPRRRIFVERTHLRGIANAGEMNSFLADRGFTPHRLEEMPFEQQVSLFANAEFVIAPHGAGLSNLLFSPKGTKVLELMPDVENRPFFWHLSATLEHTYGQMSCPVQPKSFNGRLHVDMKRLKSLYDLLENA